MPEKNQAFRAPKALREGEVTYVYILTAFIPSECVRVSVRENEGEG